MAGKTFNFGISLMTKRMIAKRKKAEMIPPNFAKPPQRETVPTLSNSYIVVFKDHFSCGLRLPSVKFLRQVLEEFEL